VASICQTQNSWNMNIRLLKTWMMVLCLTPFTLIAQEEIAPEPVEADRTEEMPVEEMTEAQRTQALFGAVNSGDTEGIKPLIVIATERGYDQIVKTLLDFGADPNQFDHLENTALNIAAAQGRYALANLLVQSGADPNHANIIGTTTIAVVAKNGHNEVANLLAEQGANPNTRNYEGIAATDYGSYLNNRELDAVINSFNEMEVTNHP